MKTRAAVVLVHGLWMHGLVMRKLARHLRRDHQQAHEFSYRSVTRSVHDNAQRLANFCATIEADEIHLVAHSLGGLIVLHMLASCRPARIGRVVLLGAPVRGSTVARAMQRIGFGRLLGRSTDAALLDPPDWNITDVPIGVIAGTTGFGAGMVFRTLAAPHDGTVSVAETRLDREQDRLELPVTHTSMLFSDRVAEAVEHFLATGIFRKAS